jgi:hypothetical protein
MERESGVAPLKGLHCVRARLSHRASDADRKLAPAAAERTPAGRRSRADLTYRAFSVFGRFNSLIVDFISLFLGFISLFDSVGNLH